LATPPLFAALAGAGRVLIAGAGGGLDVYAGLPLAVALLDTGVEPRPHRPSMNQSHQTRIRTAANED